MTPDSGPKTDPLTATDDDHRAAIRRLTRDLERMRLYAQALEERCNRLWTYVPDTHGTQDPVLPFVALHCHIVTLDDDDQASVSA